MPVPLGRLVRVSPTEKAPLALFSALQGAILPTMFRISSRPQLPASLPVPSVQFRKRARLFENSIGLNGFSAGPRPFRAWTLGQEREAGAWQGDTLKSHAHEYVGHQTQYGGASGSYSAVLQYTQTRTTGMFGESETRPVNIAQPVIIYLGRPRQMTTGCQMCWGTFCGPVGTMLDVANVETE